MRRVIGCDERWLGEGCDCIEVCEFDLWFGSQVVLLLFAFWRRARGVLRAIGSSDKVHVVDALAITGDEGRASLREVPGSWQ